MSVSLSGTEPQALGTMPGFWGFFVFLSLNKVSVSWSFPLFKIYPICGVTCLCILTEPLATQHIGTLIRILRCLLMDETTLKNVLSVTCPCHPKNGQKGKKPKVSAETPSACYFI